MAATLIGLTLAISTIQCAPSRTASSPDARPSPPEQPHATHLQPPLFLEVSGPEAVTAGQTVTVTVTIVRLAPSPAPATLCVHVPRGAMLIAGPQCETIVEWSVGRASRQYRLRVETVPADDLEFELLQQSEKIKLRAQGVYRFGRRAPRLAVPEQGKPWVVGGQQTVTVPIIMNRPQQDRVVSPRAYRRSAE